MNEVQNSNHLINEKSPYLLQHATNPVNWYPWGEKAFTKALEEDKPIFLSIGYATCHWCHVMAHESFEDKQVASLLNDHFVAIKVDREERPDVDNVYMKVCQMMTGSGGWPLSIFMTPSKEPFYAATYIPKTAKYGRIGFIDLLYNIIELWQEKRESINSTAKRIISELENLELDRNVGTYDPQVILDKAYESLENGYEEEYGGFSSAPKFPVPHRLMFLLRYYNRSKKEKALKMVEHTLEGMAKGGIFDHVGFGFHRYSTDKKWLVPHFEKMLYDQALLSILYTEAYQLTNNDKYKEVVEKILTYVARDMTHSAGGFYSAEDADSEGVEGKFYVWNVEELQDLLSEAQYKLLVDVYNVEKEGNFLEESTRQKTGENILHLDKSLDSIASEMDINTRELEKQLETIRQILYKERETRVHPLKDDKILVDWNGLMISAFAKSARVFQNDHYLDLAERAVEFIFNNLMEEERLLHRYRDGDASILGKIDDYMFFIYGLIELYETTFNPDYLKKAKTLMDNAIDLFWDENNAAFYISGEDDEELLLKDKPIYDGAIPSGNSVALMNLLRLSRIFSSNEYADMADQILKLFSIKINRNPSAYGFLLLGLEDFMLGSSYEVIIVQEGEIDLNDMLFKELNARFIPNKIVIFKSTDSPSKIEELLDYLKNYTLRNKSRTYYVCKNLSCNQPTNSIETMIEQLER